MATEADKELWQRAKELIKTEVTQIAYNTWIEPLDIKRVDNDKIVLIASNPFQRDTILSKYIDLFANTFNFLTNKKREVQILVVGEDSKELDTPSQSNTITNRSETGLRPEYTFDTFVVGNNNSFAQAAAMGVSENPGTKYNPLFLYSGVGLGKTHLMQAIGNQILANNPNAKVLYLASADFTNQLVNALKDQSTEKFREKFRNIDVLLIDDIQFIANKRSTQEEFFNTFNTLHDAGKQIVISSDKPPKDIDLLEERLKSRFGWGIIADISSPDYETRLAILRQKAQMDNIIIDDEILTNIATRVNTNIRDLEGILNKLIAKASLANSPITMEMSEKAINEVVQSKEKVISSTYIQEVIGKYFNIDPKDLVGSKRSADVTFPRQIAMYLCRNVAQMSLPQIGKDFGNRDHSTVMHSVGKIESEIKTNNNTKLIVESVKKILTSND
jgi:chromosomal replication initiator protein